MILSVKNREIVSWKLTNDKLTIQKSTRSIHKIDIFVLSGELLKILYREIPNDVVSHFKIEIRNKLRSII